jgi:hypothetical protein
MRERLWQATIIINPVDSKKLFPRTSKSEPLQHADFRILRYAGLKAMAYPEGFTFYTRIGIVLWNLPLNILCFSVNIEKPVRNK